MIHGRMRGFTLVELTVAIVLTALVSGFVVMFMRAPMDAYFAQNRRAEVNSNAETAMRRIAADVAAALPNSVRTATIGNRRIVEMIVIDDAALYRDAGVGDVLTPGTPETGFDILTPLTLNANSRLVVNNLRVANRSAYTAANSVITTAGVGSIDAPLHVALAPAFRFPLSSPNRRVYVVSHAIQYQCDLAARTLSRFDNAPITQNVVAAAGASTLIANDVTACTFRNPPLANTTHGGVLTIDMTVSRTTEGSRDQLRLLQQIRVRNPS